MWALVYKKLVGFWQSWQHDIHTVVSDDFIYKVTVDAVVCSVLPINWQSAVYPPNVYEMLTLVNNNTDSDGVMTNILQLSLSAMF